MNQSVGTPVAAAKVPAQPPDRPARLADMVVLNRRLTALADALKPLQEAAREATAGRAATEARLTGVERALSAIEGEICVRLEPRLRSAVAEAARPPAPRRRSVWLFLATAALGVGLGATYAEPLRRLAAEALVRGIALAGF